MNKFLRFISLLVLIGAFAHAQVRVAVKCPEVKGQEPFDVNKYMGRWYEIKKYPARFEEGGKCMHADYSLMDDGKVHVVNRRIMIATNEPSNIEGTATMLAPGEFNVQFPTSRNLTARPNAANYIVLGTDYETYSVVFFCYPTGPESSAQFAWFLSKEKNPTQDAHDKVDEIFGHNQLSRSYLTLTDQEQYSFLVLIGAFAHAQVRFIAKCPKVKGQEPFDINKYMGRWYEIKKYPIMSLHSAENRKCRLTDYSLMDDGKIRVVNRQIMIATNESFSVEGTSTMVAPGEFKVRFPTSKNLTRVPNYIVLGTDYETYSVVFFCYQTGPESSAQFAWFLSREKNPSQDAHDKVDEIFGHNQLSRSYLTVTDQEQC